MDDLLIVRRAERFKKATSQRRDMRVGLGANFGLIIGTLFGFIIGQSAGAPLEYSIMLGAIIGIASFGVTGRFLKPNRRYQKSLPDYSYKGLPFTEEENPSKEA